MLSGCGLATDRTAETPAPRHYRSSETDAPPVALGPLGGEGPSVRIREGGSSGAGGRDPDASGIDDNAGLGFNTGLYMSSEIPKVVIETDAVVGHEPSQQTLNLLRTRLASVSDKSGGIEILPVETFKSDAGDWTQDELVAAEKRSRDRWSNHNEMVLYVLYVDKSFAEDENALGVAFKSSTVVVFIEQVRESAATPLVTAQNIENAVAVHELGHVLALVNIGYASPRDHEDSQHDGHSSNTRSVMYWAMDNVGVANLLDGRTSLPTDFDADDRADLADLRSGKLRV